MKLPDLRHLDGYLPPDMEKTYRQFYLKADITVASVMLGFFSLLIAVFAYNDYEIFGFTPAFYFLAALRSLYLAYFIALMIFLSRTRNPARFDLSLLISLIAGFLLLAAINLGRPSNNLGTFAVDIIIILIIYLEVPIRLLFRAGAALVLSLTEILTFAFFREMPPGAAMYTVVVVLLAANIIGISASTRLYAFRRREFRAHTEQVQAAEQIQDLYNKAPAGYHSLDKDGFFVQINDTELGWLGYSREEIIGKKRFSDLVTAEGRETFRKNFPILKERGWVKNIQFDMVRKNGSRMAVLVNATAIRDESGNYLSSRSTVFDVTETRRLQRDIAESEKKYRTILEEMNDAYFEVDLTGKITMENNTMCQMLLVTKEELIGKSFKHYVTTDDAKVLLAAFRSIYETGTPSKGMVFNAVRKDGSTFYVEISVSPMRNEQGEFIGFRCVGRDVSERVEFQNKIAEMAMHDSLTNLPNRSLLYDRFNIAQGQAERGNRRMALMELDLDHFKLINDTMGHAAGDDLLQAVALRLTGVVRKSDTVARLGGDEFAVLVPEISQIDDAIATAGKILAAFQQPFTIDGTELTVTTSIGIAIYPVNGATIEKLLEAADTAMYNIKGHGRNNYELAEKQ